jgi:hypothetical protein
MREARELYDGFGTKRAIRVANHCADELHRVSTQRRSAGVKSVAPEGTGTLVTKIARGFANASVEFKREAVTKLIRKELQELRKMPFLSDIGRETADKAEPLFAFINSRFSA